MIIFTMVSVSEIFATKIMRYNEEHLCDKFRTMIITLLIMNRAEIRYKLWISLLESGDIFNENKNI
jgi:hypothetical protein